MSTSFAPSAALPALPVWLRAVVFDFDGTLAVPTLDFALMRRHARQAVAALVPPEMLAGHEARSMGQVSQQEEEARPRPLMEELNALCAALTAAGNGELAMRVRAVAMKAVAEVEVEAAARSSLFPFVRPLLRDLRAGGLGLAVITRNCPAAVYRVFPDADDFFSCVLTRDDVARVKPHPEHLLAALERLGRAPDETLMIGDHPMDIQVGKAAGARTAGVAAGEAPRALLAAAGPDYLGVDVPAVMEQLWNSEEASFRSRSG